MKQIAIAIVLILNILFCAQAKAASARELNASIDTALEEFYDVVGGGEKLVSEAKGVLVFPNIFKAGIFLVGGEYGEGALIADNKLVDYYNTATGSFGWQLGAQKKSLIILFMDDEALYKFRTKSNWKAGVDASVTLITVGADGSLDTAKTNQPIIAFVVGQKGLMYNLTLEGTKITKIKK